MLYITMHLHLLASTVYAVDMVCADWFLEYVEVEDRATGRLWFFPCLKWLGSGSDGGQLSRDLYPADPTLKGQNRRDVEQAIGLQQKGAPRPRRIDQNLLYLAVRMCCSSRNTCVRVCAHRGAQHLPDLSAHGRRVWRGYTYAKRSALNLDGCHCVARARPDRTASWRSHCDVSSDVM